ncbi:MAG: DsbA family oxidoreductase [Rhodobacteraceae bacterium]|jgi:predicted DsbA family dithiol-disulfide isomerase|nr:DsbA family oxidoreductase [Paracoccaceae bacterium]
MIRLEIFSDPVCPWCLIGRAHLERALAGLPLRPFAIAWQPFQLNPDMPAGGLPRADYLAAKFGSPARAAELLARVAAVAAEAGLAVDLAAARRQPNTLDAHRLIHWAGIEGRQEAVVAGLFDAFFGIGRDIGDAAVLADIAAAAGMDGAVVARLLASDADRDEIAARDARARARGIRAVPTFIVAGRHVVEGAQPPAFWRQVVEALAAGGGTAEP